MFVDELYQDVLSTQATGVATSHATRFSDVRETRAAHTVRAARSEQPARCRSRDRLSAGATVGSRPLSELVQRSVSS